MKKNGMDLTKPTVMTALALAATLLWGSAYPCIKLGYAWFGMEASDIPAKFLYAGIRFFAAGLLTLLLGTIMEGHFPLPKKESLPGLAGLGLVLTSLHYIFFYIGLANTTGVKGAIVYATSTLFTVILAALIYKNDRLTPIRIGGCALGFFGIILVNLTGEGLSGGFSAAGEGSMLLAAILFAIGNLLSKRMAGKESSVTVTGWQLSIGGAVLILLGVVTKGHLPVITLKGCLLLLYLSFLSAAAFTMWTLLLQANAVGRVMVYNFLVPIFGVLLSGLLLHEPFLSVRNVTALACVSFAIYLVNREGIKKEGKA